MKTLSLFFIAIFFASCFTSTSRVYDSEYNRTNREVVYNHLLGNSSKAIPNAKLKNETLDSTSYKLEYTQGENCSGYVIVEYYKTNELKVVVNYGCLDLKHTTKTREDFLDELGGLLH